MKPNRITSAGTKADSTTTADATTSSQTIAKPNVSGSASSGFLTDAVNELLTYKTPKAIVDLINRNLIIANPPYNVKK
jgi:hypothetical protein